MSRHLLEEGDGFKGLVTDVFSLPEPRYLDPISDPQGNHSLPARGKTQPTNLTDPTVDQIDPLRGKGFRR